MLSDRFGSRKALVWPFVALAVVIAFPFAVTGAWITVILVLFALFACTIPPAMFAVAPEVMGKPQLAGLGMGMVSMGQNLGMFVGPILFGALAQSSGWSPPRIG